VDESNPLDEKELLRAQIKAFEFYAQLIERAVGGSSRAKLPRWDEQRAAEYHALAEQLRQRLAELEAQEAQQEQQGQDTQHKPAGGQVASPAPAPASTSEDGGARAASEAEVAVSSGDAEAVAQE
jgi:hypothetical protein